MKRALFPAFCLVIVATLAADDARTNKSAVAYVQKLQAKDGGFKASAAAPESSLRATSAALRALKYFGGELPDRADCVKFVESCHDKASGGFADRPGGKPDVFTTAVGMMAINELKLPGKPYAEKVLAYLVANAKTFDEIRIAAAGFEAVCDTGAITTFDGDMFDAWQKEVSKAINADGTFGKGDDAARETARRYVTAERLTAKADNRTTILRAMRAGQRADGGFGKGGAKGSDLESSYQVMRAFHRWGAKPDAGKMRDFVASCRNADGGYGVQPGQPSSVPATYYASIILHWLDAK